MNMESFDWAGMAQKVVIAVIILLVTWLLAKIVKWAIGKLVGRVKGLQRQGNDGAQVGESLGKVAALIIWLFGLVAILQVFALSEVLAPVQDLLGKVMGFIPNLIGAGIIFFIGYMIAKIVRQLVTTALGAVDFGKLTSKLKRGAVEPSIQETREQNAKIIGIIGNLLFAIIIIVVGISALQVLGIAAISDPAQQMLTMIMNAIPQIVAALILLAIGYVIAKFVGTILQSTLEGIGTDSVVHKWGIVPADKSASSIIATLVKIAIMLFFGIMAARLMNFPEVTNILNQILALAGNVLFGGLIIAAGFVIANIVVSIVGPGTAATIIRWATIVLFIAMGLKYMGLADSIINMAFGAVVIGGALAAALAFGLGGRDAAARALQKVENKQPPATHSAPIDPLG
ncbi:mechanosensitive ion channel [Paeniglutamicibacter terrestris]|uniref:Mechanosensitive ion channel n=1 Tax=Paeniglutamicibacter terrestris TaxID=2723403 RepID=A0ABX1G3N9_9MICC|nr:mechanosensitive ion channel [Paeniglutamicibacter terrestris]NKG20371.1 mechanosensitive ion channel [Paeniglutamicibacter terrestris]